jgi:hypothetical protein
MVDGNFFLRVVVVADGCGGQRYRYAGFHDGFS